MKVPINWLKQYVPLTGDLSEWSKQLTSIGHMQDGPPKQVGEDIVYDFEIRQNRSDCLSLLGIARETAAVLNTKLESPYDNLEILKSNGDAKTIEIKNTNACYRFQTIVVRGVKLGPSPEWMQQHLISYGIKPINIVVDVTNYVMVEIGEPMHAYDVREVKNTNFIVRNAEEGESIEVLGEKKIQLTKDDLVIADSEKILSIAGVIGGEHTSIKDDTADIILEAATYNQAYIRRSSLRHSLRTEASLRHEKFLHPDLVPLALSRAVQLITQYAGGTVTAVSDEYPAQPSPITITLTLRNLSRLGGTDIDLLTAESLLTKLGFTIQESTTEELKVIPPYYRTDIEIEEDVIEEVLRLYGYDNIPYMLPKTPPPKDIQSKQYMLEERMRDILIACGYDEQITDPLVNEANSKLQPVVLENSLNSEKTMLRTTLKNTLLHAGVNQQKHRKENVLLFEIGKRYYMDGELYKEEHMLALLAISPSVTYFKVKGVIEELLEKLGLSEKLDGIVIERLPMKTPAYFTEFSIENWPLRDYAEKPAYTFHQSVFEDLSFFVEKSTQVGKIMDAVQNSSPIVYRVSLIEDRMMNDKRSILLRVQYRNAEDTVSNQQVEEVRNSIKTLIESQFGAALRTNNE